MSQRKLNFRTECCWVSPGRENCTTAQFSHWSGRSLYERSAWPLRNKLGTFWLQKNRMQGLFSKYTQMYQKVCHFNYTFGHDKFGSHSPNSTENPTSIQYNCIGKNIEADLRILSKIFHCLMLFDKCGISLDWSKFCRSLSPFRLCPQSHILFWLSWTSFGLGAKTHDRCV